MKPNIFRSGIFMKYNNAVSSKTPEQYKKHLRIVAILLIAAGFAVLIYDNFQLFYHNSGVI